MDILDVETIFEIVSYSVVSRDSVRIKKMEGFMKHKIMQNLVILEKFLNLNDRFKKLSMQWKVFSQLLDNVMKYESPTMNYSMMLISRGPNAFTQFIDILTETKQWICF